jgi:VWFA-related protein
MRSSLSLLLLVLLLGVSGAAMAQTFSEATDVVVVEVPVTVLDADGKPVRGLTVDNFEVYERGRKQKVVGFEVLDLNVAIPDVPVEGEKFRKATPMPISARRHFLLLFDLSFTSPVSATKAKEAARGILQKLHPSDLVAVGSYISTKGAELLLAFSGDRDQALAAIDQIAKPTSLDYKRDPLRLVLGAGVPAGEGAGGGEVEGGRGTARERVRATLGEAGADFDQFTEISMERSEREHQERSVTAMTRSLGELARMMQGLRGRKHVLLFSEGFDGALLRGSANLEDQLSMAASSTMGEYWNIDSEKRFGSTKSATNIEDMLEEFRRADCVIQAVDTGGLREGARPEDQFSGGKDSLFLMAKETGGELYENYNDLEVALTDMLERNSVTYVLAFQPEKVERDGAYHRLKVELKAPKKGIRLVHRPGYYSPRPHDQQNPLEQALSAGERILSGFDGGTIRTSVLTAPFRVTGPDIGPGIEAYVPVLIEADGDTLLAGGDPKGAALPAEIFAYAFDSEGKVRDYFSQNMSLDIAKVGPALRENGLKFFGHLDLPPGEYSVRVLIRTGNGAWGLKAASVSVPDFAEPVLLQPFFPEKPGQWLIVREAAREGDRTVPYPFLAGEVPYIPSSLPKLAPGKETAMALVVYHLQPGELRAEARILTPEGREAGTGEVRILQRHGRGEDGADRVAATFEPPAGLNPGEYLLLLTIVDAQGGAESSAAAFTVPGA